MEKLQSITPYRVMNIKECLDALGWTYEEEEDTYNNIACDCGGKLEFSGFIGTELIECPKCKKHMVDLFSPIQVSNSTCTVLRPSDYELDENRHWIAINGSGGVKLNGKDKANDS